MLTFNFFPLNRISSIRQKSKSRRRCQEFFHIKFKISNGLVLLALNTYYTNTLQAQMKILKLWLHNLFTSTKVNSHSRLLWKIYASSLVDTSLYTAAWERTCRECGVGYGHHASTILKILISNQIDWLLLVVKQKLQVKSLGN